MNVDAILSLELAFTDEHSGMKSLRPDSFNDLQTDLAKRFVSDSSCIFYSFTSHEKDMSGLRLRVDYMLSAGNEHQIGSKIKGTLSKVDEAIASSPIRAPYTYSVKAMTERNYDMGIKANILKSLV